MSHQQARSTACSPYPSAQPVKNGCLQPAVDLGPRYVPWHPPPLRIVLWLQSNWNGHRLSPSEYLPDRCASGLPDGPLPAQQFHRLRPLSYCRTGSRIRFRSSLVAWPIEGVGAEGACG